MEQEKENKEDQTQSQALSYWHYLYGVLPLGLPILLFVYLKKRGVFSSLERLCSRLR